MTREEIERLAVAYGLAMSSGRPGTTEPAYAALLSAIDRSWQEWDERLTEVERERARWKFTADEQSKIVDFLRGCEQQANEQARKESEDVDDLIEQLGLNVEQCRTDGGWLNVPKIIGKLKDDPPWTRAALADTTGKGP